MKKKRFLIQVIFKKKKKPKLYYEKNLFQSLIIKGVDISKVDSSQEIQFFDNDIGFLEETAMRIKNA